MNGLAIGLLIGFAIGWFGAFLLRTALDIVAVMDGEEPLSGMHK